MQIDIFADPICPWCYIGKRRLERALAQRKIENARIRWRVYQIDPDIPACGISRDAYLEAKFGGAARSRKFFNAIARVGKSEGIAFDFGRIDHVPNTTQAHRLIRFALDTPHLDALIEALTDIDSTRKMGEAARGRVETDHTYRRQCEQTLEVYRAAMERRLRSLE